MQLFPKEIVEHSVEHHFWTHSVRSQLLYSSVLVTLLGALAALPFLYVDVSVKSQGIIRPFSKRKALTSPVSGRILELDIKENSTYPKGHIAVKIAAPRLQERLVYNRQQQTRVKQKQADLTRLLRLDSVEIRQKILQLQLPVYQQTLAAFREELDKQAAEVKNARISYKRNKYLYEQKVLSFVDYDKSRYAYHSARNQYQLTYSRQINQWQIDLEETRLRLEELRSEEQKITKNISRYTIHMPASGTIQSMAGITEGSYVQAQQKLADISPDTGLIAEMYVSPGDIGLIKKGMRTRFQINAFDYNRWGTLKGIVTEISNDAVMSENEPFFIVRSSLNRTYLQLPNGYKGQLKKGMTLQARFKITRRSLFQLLYDNVDDWLNPTRDDENSFTDIPGS